MSCLGVERIYAYLEEDLPAAERRLIEKHLAGCAACRAAVEDRRCLMAAARTLPPLTLPPGFATEVMQRIRIERIPARNIVIAASLGFTAMLSTMLGVLLWSGQGLFDLLAGLNQSAFASLEGFFVTCAKLLRTVILLARVLRQSLGSLLGAFARTGTLLSPEFQAAVLVSVFALSFGLYILIRKKFAIGESE